MSNDSNTFVGTFQVKSKKTKEEFIVTLIHQPLIDTHEDLRDIAKKALEATATKEFPEKYYLVEMLDLGEMES